jgi:RNA-directed DNA polymerase
MSYKLVASDNELQAHFFVLKTLLDVALLLDVEHSHLVYYLYRMPNDKKYISFEIPKTSGGKRIITSPTNSLKILQRKLKQVLEAVYTPKKCVHGFVKGHSIRTNAIRHKRQHFVLNLDLKEFFPSINFGRVRGMFIAKPYNLEPNVATILSQLCCFNNELPQGAPTSPIIANMLCAKLDSQLQKLARDNRCYYTRFADDLTFSTSLAEIPKNIAFWDGNEWRIGQGLLNIISQNGFEVQFSKFRVQNEDQRQQVTGITVNDFPNVNRKYVRQIRAMLHDWEVNGYEIAEENHFKTRKFVHRNPESGSPEFRKILEGKISFLRMVRQFGNEEDPIHARFIDKYNFLLERDELGLDPASDNPSGKIFISYSRKDEKFAKKLAGRFLTKKEKVWLDTNDIRASKKWSNAIEDGLGESDVMVLIVSPPSMESENVANEWQYFLDEEKPIIPVFLYGSDKILKFELRRIQYIDFREIGKFESNFNKLLSEIYETRKLSI